MSARYGLGECTYFFKRGWRCTRERLHAGPCALYPRWWNWSLWACHYRGYSKGL